MEKPQAVYPGKESKVLEFKSQVPAFSTLIKTCVAFANTAGGRIVIGVEDETQLLVGVSDRDRERIYNDFPNSLYDSTAPGLFVHIYEKNLGDQVVLIIEVPLSAKKPVYIKQDGIPKGVYIRVGASNRRAQQVHVEDLMRESKREYFDLEPTQASLEDLSDQWLADGYGDHWSTKKLLADSVIVPNPVGVEKYSATVAGTLMFHDAPHQYIPEATVLCTQFSGTKGRDIAQTRELTGPISQLVDESLTLISSWLERNLVLVHARLKGEIGLPMPALREAVVNALIHRKYSVAGAVKIALYDDRLEIFSPGSFLGLVDINNLGDGTTCLRNPHLTQIARKMKLVEKLGTGIRLIFDECQKLGLKKPEYKEGGDFVKLIFYFSKCMTGADSQAIILEYMNKNVAIRVSDVASLLNVSRNTATRKLNDLIKAGEIIRLGKGPSVRYVVSRSSPTDY